MRWPLLPALFVLLLLALEALGADPSSPVQPPRFPLDVVPPFTLSLAPVSSIALGRTVVVLDQTTLADVVKQVRIGRIDHAGDASESAYWLCYSVQGPNGQDRLWLLSHGE